MISTNEDHLVETAVQVQVHAPHRTDPYQVSSEGNAYNLPVPHCICYNVRVGDPAFGWAADHTEPNVTTDNPDMAQSMAVSKLVCVGNRAFVVTGDAKGAEGVVTGYHGGFIKEAVLVDWPPDVVTKLVYGDQILIRTVGRGLVLTDYPAIRTLSISPRLLHAMGVRDGPDGKLVVPVAAIVPPQFMGSGVGSTAEIGDYDIMTADKEALAEADLDRLRLGDFVALRDRDDRYGHCYRRGALTIGIVSHGDSQWAGHGPGVVVLFGAGGPVIEPEIDAEANIAIRLRIRALQPSRGARRKEQEVAR